jgi:hypothetical protein
MVILIDSEDAHVGVASKPVALYPVPASAVNELTILYTDYDV